MTVVVAEGAGVAFPGSARPALDGVDLLVRAGETVAVVGATGAGKSTLARLLVGLIPGHLPAEVSGRLTRPDVVGYVPERAEAALIEPRVGDDVGLGLPPEGRGERVAAALAAVGLEGLEGRATGELSGGQVQRVAIAAHQTCGHGGWPEAVARTDESHATFGAEDRGVQPDHED